MTRTRSGHGEARGDALPRALDQRIQAEFWRDALELSDEEVATFMESIGVGSAESRADRRAELQTSGPAPRRNDS